MRSILVRRHELGLWFRDGDFHEVLGPGRHRLLNPLFWRDTVEVVDTSKLRVRHARLEQMVESSSFREHAVVLDLAGDQRALVWRRGRLESIVGPGLHAWWNLSADLETEVFGVGAVRFEHPRLATILEHASSREWIDGVEVAEHERVLLHQDGRLVEQLGAGRHCFWRGAGHVEWQSIDLREQLLEIGGQEIMTRDKVSVRANLSVALRVVDAVRALRSSQDWTASAYRSGQLALRAVLGTRTLDELLADKDAAAAELLEELRTRTAELGVEVRAAGLRDLILPGEMKELLNQVVQAEKQAQANLIRRREETAAARSQANTARLLADNPVLARMKELELVQEILSHTRASFVFGSADVSRELLGLVRPAGEGDEGKPS